MERSKYWGWVNTYTYSDFQTTVTRCIVRPSIVESARRNGMKDLIPIPSSFGLYLKGHRNIVASESNSII